MFDQCYRRILQLDPTNIQGLHNLCVVMVERGKLRQAEQCLDRAAAMAPQQDYIHRHLAIVRARISRLSKEELAANSINDEDDIFNESLLASLTQVQGAQPQQKYEQQAQESDEDEFIDNADSAVFRNRAVVHNHLGNKQKQQQPATESIGDRLDENFKGKNNVLFIPFISVCTKKEFDFNFQWALMIIK